MNDKELKDEQFVPVVITHPNGTKQKGYFYKPQRILITDFITEGFANCIGIIFEEDNNADND